MSAGIKTYFSSGVTNALLQLDAEFNFIQTSRVNVNCQLLSDGEDIYKISNPPFNEIMKRLF